MLIINTIKETREYVNQWKKEGFSIGFVPTMGYLHEGHESLVIESAAHNDKTIVSIYVNPTQFAPTEDFASYPRDLQKDAEMCENAGADLIFCPTDEEMYTDRFGTYINMDNLTRELCGMSRPTHFRGVCTVVGKLFNIVTPDRAYFGQKDAQQLAVIRRMVKDLNFNTEIIGCPIVRESDGLAKSSRNTYLSAEERKAALVLSKAVFEGERLVKSGETDVDKIISVMKGIISSEPLARIDYVEVVDADTIEKINSIPKGNATVSVLAAVAVFVGKTRLIDNFIVNK